MFCTKCGQSVTPGAAFCAHCGNVLTNTVQQPQAPPASEQQPQAPPASGWPPPPTASGWQPQAPTAGMNWQPPMYPASANNPPQGYYAPPQQAYAGPPPKKKKTGLIIGLLAGIVLLAVAAVLLFAWPGFLKPGTPVAGVWYSDNRGEAIRFDPDGSFDAYTNYGDFNGEYQYDLSTGRGHISMSDEREFDFSVKQDQLYVDNMGLFAKADEAFDIKDFISNVQKDNATK